MDRNSSRADSAKEGSEHPWLKELAEQDQVKGLYLVRDKALGTTRKGETFISLVLADRSGEVEAKVWNQAEILAGLFERGEVIEVEGEAVSYRERLQLKVTRLRRPEEDYDRSLFIESAPLPAAEMAAALRELLKTIQDRHLRLLIDRILTDRELMERFRQAPAAKNMHHNYLGGLLEHTLAVCRLARAVAEHYPVLNADLLLAGAFLHDLGKVQEFSYDLDIDYTHEGRLLGHVVLGTAILDRKLAEIKNFPPDLALRLRHLILSHHGEYAFGSPKRPKFLEGFALHMIDDLDAKMNGLARFMERDRQAGAWTEWNRMFERFFLKGRIDGLNDKESSPAAEKTELQGKLFVT